MYRFIDKKRLKVQRFSVWNMNPEVTWILSCHHTSLYPHLQTFVLVGLSNICYQESSRPWTMRAQRQRIRTFLLPRVVHEVVSRISHPLLIFSLLNVPVSDLKISPEVEAIEVLVDVVLLVRLKTIRPHSRRLTTDIKTDHYFVLLK